MIISIFNQKGGVSKTTTAVNLSYGLAIKNKKTLLVDLDPQNNATSACGLDCENDDTIYEILIGQVNDVRKTIKHINEYLDLIPSNISLANADMQLSNEISRELILKSKLDEISKEYDFIIIDCPPSLGLLSINALAVSQRIIIPVYPSFFSVKGIKDMINTYNLVKSKLNSQLKIMGVLVTKYDSRKNINRNIMADLKSTFGDKFFNTLIRVNAKIEEAQENQKSIFEYDIKSNGAVDYMEFTEEVLKNARKG